MILVLKIIGAIAALVLGIWLGLGSGSGPTARDVEERLGKDLPRYRATRHFTFLNLLQRKSERGSHRRRKGARRDPFKL